MFVGIGHIEKSRKATIGTQIDMQLAPSFLLEEFRPRKSGETKIDHCGVEEVQLSLEGELMLGRFFSCAFR